GDRDGRDALHAVAIDPGEARGARLRDLASDRLDVDGAADARSLRGEQLHGVLLGQRREQGAPQRREVDGDARPGGLDVAQRVAAFLDARHVYLAPVEPAAEGGFTRADRKSTRLNSSHVKISYAVFCLKKKKLVFSV